MKWPWFHIVFAIGFYGCSSFHRRGALCSWLGIGKYEILVERSSTQQIISEEDPTPLSFCNFFFSSERLTTKEAPLLILSYPFYQPAGGFNYFTISSPFTFSYQQWRHEYSTSRQGTVRTFLSILFFFWVSTPKKLIVSLFISRCFNVRTSDLFAVLQQQFPYLTFKKFGPSCRAH